MSPVRENVRGWSRMRRRPQRPRGKEESGKNGAWRCWFGRCVGSDGGEMPRGDQCRAGEQPMIQRMIIVGCFLSNPNLLGPQKISAVVGKRATWSIWHTCRRRWRMMFLTQHCNHDLGIRTANNINKHGLQPTRFKSTCNGTYQVH